MSAPGPYLSFLTDFGENTAPAVCRGVIWSIVPAARINDLTHASRQFAVRDGAFLLWSAIPYLPIGVHLAVVDPGVGTARRAVGLRCGRGDVLIGPDNGLLIPAAEALGGVEEARELANRDLWLPVTTSTFHGRDVFAPVAANLAAGASAFRDVGTELAVAELVRLPAPAVRTSNGVLETEVTYVDSFGNLRLHGGRRALEAAFGDATEGDRFGLSVGGRRAEAVALERSFGHVAPGALILYVDSSGDLAIGANQADLAARLGVESGEPVRIHLTD